MIRKCVVCDRTIKINVDEKGHYDGGHYFGRLKIPEGEGKYEKIGLTKILKKEIPVAKWTGKEKEVEYWECNKCYENALHLEWLEQLVEKLYGKRCKDYGQGCPCCEAWSIYDNIVEELEGKL